MKSGPMNAIRRKNLDQRDGAKRKRKAGGDGRVSGKELVRAEREGAAKERRVEA